MPDLGQAPIHQQHFAIGSSQYIFGFDVAVSYTVGVGVFEGMADLQHHFNKLGQIIALTIIQNFTQGVTMQELHSEVGIAAGVSAQFIGGHSIGMLQHGRDPRLPYQALLFEFIRGKFWFQGFITNEARQV